MSFHPAPAATGLSPAGTPTAPAAPVELPVAVVGGGIAGLATAYELARRGVGCVVLDRAAAPGGVIRTETLDGFIIDTGPDALLALKPAAVALCRELGLGDRLLPTLRPRQAFIVRSGVLHALPEASVLGIPTRVWPLATTGLFSWRGKARMAMDLVLPRRPPTRSEDDDESIAAFIRRRFGQEAVDYLAEPLLAGIHSGRVDRLSMRALFPRLVEAEAASRSLILAFRRMHARPSPDGIFRSLPGGLGEMVDTLVRALPQGTWRGGTAVASVDRRPGGGYALALETGEIVAARSVVLATPAYVTARLVANLDPLLAALCDAIPYASSVTVALGYRRADVAHPLRGSGFVVPARERQLHLMAGSWVSSKWPHRAPEGFVLLRAFLGGARNPELLGRDDGDLVRLAHEEMARIHGIHGEPVVTRLARWERANAQHEVGHPARIRRIEARLADLPGLFVTGSAYRGTGITDCVADGRATAEQVARFVGAGSGAGLVTGP
jgi:oxygen-dependent protoporphyrinogen oxidase